MITLVTVADVDYRTLILDAAQACLMEKPMSAPLHARIAARAGLSRPTLYKYVGDQDQIFRAVMEREATRYVEAIIPELGRQLPLPDHFAQLTAFSVDFFRASPLISAVLEHDGQRFLAWLAAEFQQVVRDAVRPLVPMLEQQLPTTRELPIPVEELLEWGVRMSIGLVFMPSPSRDLATTVAVEEYVRGFLEAFGPR